jgi:GMP synthase (glutamine-hydrolysing)
MGVHPGSIVILDFGGQYAHLIANRVRRLGAYSDIRVPETTADALKGAAGIILSGGPQSVYEKGSPQADPKIFSLGIPVLGLCYGHQWMAHALGGTVESGKIKEYGETRVGKKVKSEQSKEKNETLPDVLVGLPDFLTTWMSHGDVVTKVPEGFSVTLTSENGLIAAMACPQKKFYGIQFHIEVTHTPQGMEILRNFVALCTPAPWTMEGYGSRIGAELKNEVGKRNVFMLVSGGVDSTVAFTLMNKVLGADRVRGLLVDTGLMRKGEVEMIKHAFDALGVTNLHIEDASNEFFRNLQGVTDPEEKRRIIGTTFLDVQRRVSAGMGLTGDGTWMLGQGTIYPDTIESKGTKHADHIKTHHNRVEAIQRMIEQGLIIEPLKELYKDEVRMLGEELGLPKALVWRHPFPGPGLGVRLLCAEHASHAKFPDVSMATKARELITVPHTSLPVRSVGVQGDGRTYRHAVALFSHHPCRVTPEHRALAKSVPNAIPVFNRVLLCTSHVECHDIVFTPGTCTKERADLLREADAIAQEEMRSADLTSAIWQFPVVLLPCGATKGNQSIVLRPISSTDAMTADAYTLPEPVLAQMTRRILDLPGIDMVFLDLTSKPPGTIEWE